jgi:hypothetical protein
VTIAIPSGSFSDTAPTQNALVIDGGDGDPPGLRVVFKAVKTTGKEPNTFEVTPYNLAPTHRALIQQKGVRVMLEAGYVTTGLATVAIGDVRTADPIREGADWKSVLKCGDGERAFRFARTAESFAGGSTVADVVNYCANAMGLALGNTSDQASKLSVQLGHGWTVLGAASSELARILATVGYRYSVQDGQIQILLPGDSIAQTIPDVTPQTGLIGSPEMGAPDKKGKPPTLKFRSLLLPQSRPGGRVHVKSERYDGIFTTVKVTHSGDTRGNEWYSDFESVQDTTARVA